MGRGIDALLRRLYRSGLRRGMSGEHWAWFVLAGAAYLLKRARQPDGKAARIHLRSGDRYVIEVSDASGRHGRRESGESGARRDRGVRPRVVWHGERVTTAVDHAE